MFPILEIESRYQQYLKWNLDIAGLEEVAQLTEQWLLEFEGERDPAMAAIQNLCLQSSVEYDKRMLFAICLALCFPSEHTGRVFSAYRRHIDQEMPNIQFWMTTMNAVLNSNGQAIDIDVVKGLRQASPETIEIASNAYGVDRADIILDAIAWDDLKLFELAITDREDSARHMGLSALAKFDPAPDSKIHQALIVSDEDEKDFFFYQAQEVRARLFEDYFGGSNYARPTGDRWATLLPNGVVTLAVSASDDQSFYKRSDFKERLMKEPERIIKSFFLHLNTVSDNGMQAASITQAFLDAGIPASYLVEHGPCAPKLAQLEDYVEEDMSLKKALSRFESMSIDGQDFYTTLYTQYLKEFTTQQIIELCDTPESLASAYRLTGDRVFLQAGDESTRSIVMSQDLGL
ncbi:hypothetical protein [Pseudomonas amygdali]|nr:hypothetical protein [Pseudomonas amygdali]AXH59570.1 hypothetical protein PLA107_030560 [Pseudomonas amygdali pv. lachrymans str. M301315]RMT06477.1 hypothetical protein ALP54_03491 [Pseudomonas amygdali pv. lachrymans]